MAFSSIPAPPDVARGSEARVRPGVTGRAAAAVVRAQAASRHTGVGAAVIGGGAVGVGLAADRDALVIRRSAAGNAGVRPGEREVGGFAAEVALAEVHPWAPSHTRQTWAAVLG